jgi:periplasmic protein TonB
VLQTLLESRTKKSRSAGGTIASVVGHTILIAAALYATAQADGHTRTMPDAYSPVFLSPVRSVPAPAASADKPKTSSRWNPPQIDTRISIDVRAPTIDVAATLPNAGDFARNSFSSDGAPASGASGVAGSGGAYDAGQVDRQVSLAPGTQPPRYPEVLRASGVEGQLVALFVVDEQGRVEETSIRFAQPGNALFEDAVRVALRRMRFTPAEAGGRKVRQLVQMPFVFTLSR